MPAWLVAGATGVVLTLVVCAGTLWWWGRSSDAPAVSYRRIDIADERADLADVLAAAGAPSSGELLRAYRAVWHPFAKVPLGAHWINVNLPPQELLAILTRSRGRAVTRVMLPEGWDAYQMADKLAASGVCDREEFLAAVFGGPEGAEASDSEWDSFEGRLYPSSYDFRLNTAARDVVSRLVAEAEKRHREVFTAHAPQAERLAQVLNLAPKDVVTLASIVEKEAANEGEFRLIASVFLNRLEDPQFRPARMLQSDPTAAYGCKRDRLLESCRAFTGKVTAAMLRDGKNPFNTYRHPGLPPTPIGNPSSAAITAVLTAPATDYLFFVSPDGGPHRFSRTLQEHERHLR